MNKIKKEKKNIANDYNVHTYYDILLLTQRFAVHINNECFALLSFYFVSVQIFYTKCTTLHNI